MRTFETHTLDASLVLRGGNVWNQQTKKFETNDILLDQGKIQTVGQVPETSGREVDISGASVVPGFLDLHVHFREPGREDKETIESGARCAVVGGFTSVCPMPNTDPVIDSAEMIRFLKDRSRSVMVDVLPVGAVTKGQQGKELADIGEMVQAGAVAISDDGRTIDDAELMRMALEYSRMYDITIMVHAENRSLSAGGSMHEGLHSTRLGVKGIPAVSEVIAIQRDIALAEYTDGRVHIQHLTTGAGVELIRRAKDAGIKVTTEVTPHHLALCDTDIIDYDTHMKMSPPLRTREDRAALIAGLADGAIDCIGTDHAPHTVWEKELEFDNAPFGVLGLETAFGIVGRELLNSGAMSLADIVDRMVVAPRRILGLDVPEIAAGHAANLTIVRLDAAWTVTRDDLQSRSANTSFMGQTLQGRVIGTICNGQCWLPEMASEATK